MRRFREPEIDGVTMGDRVYWPRQTPGFPFGRVVGLVRMADGRCVVQIRASEDTHVVRELVQVL